MPKYASEAVCAAILDTGGVLKNIAANLGSTLAEARAAIDDCPAAALAMAEEALKIDSLIHERLVEQAQQGNVTAMRELERRQARDVRKAQNRRTPPT